MGSTKNWIALEDNYTKAGSSLASTVVCSGNGDKDRDPFAINVSYYVKASSVITLQTSTSELQSIDGVKLIQKRIDRSITKKYKYHKIRFKTKFNVIPRSKLIENDLYKNFEFFKLFLISQIEQIYILYLPNSENSVPDIDVFLVEIRIKVPNEWSTHMYYCRCLGEAFNITDGWSRVVEATVYPDASKHGARSHRFSIAG